MMPRRSPGVLPVVLIAAVLAAAGVAVPPQSGARNGERPTYMPNGRQHIVVAVSGAGYSGQSIAYRLPAPDAGRPPARPALAAETTLVVRAQNTAPRSVRAGVYRTAQADQGRALYGDKCASCHGTMKAVTPEMGPLLSDHVFRQSWNGRTLGELYTRVRETMPQNEPGTLTPEQVVNVIAYILSGNEMPPGEAALPQDPEALERILWDAGQP